jgi:hypothetical protein
LASAGGGKGGAGATTSTAQSGFNGLANTGGGGGGGSNGDTTYPQTGGVGGSGIVVIRYPSYLAPATSTTGSPETYVTGFWRVYRFVASGTITF